MKNRFRFKLKDILSTILLVASVVVFSLSYLVASSPETLDGEAKKTGEKVGKMISELNGYLDSALETQEGEWMEMENLPEDMVIYLYDKGQLVSWSNSFPTLYDDLRKGYQSFDFPGYVTESPLRGVGPDPVFINLGPKWYVAKTKVKDGRMAIGGVEIINERDAKTHYGINPDLKVASQYTILPLYSEDGVDVAVDGQPLFKMVDLGTSESTSFNTLMFWVALILLLVASLAFIWAHPRLLTFFVMTGLSLTALTVFYFLGKNSPMERTIFSPLPYSGGEYLYSLAALVLLNLMLVVTVFGLYFTRKKISSLITTKFRAWVLIAVCLVAVCAIGVYFNYALQNVAKNAMFSMELYRLRDMTWFGFLAYFSLVNVAVLIPLLVRLTMPSIKLLTGRDFDILEALWRIVYSALVGLYIIITVWSIGIKKEEARADALAESLSVSCDLELESALKDMEGTMASDPLLSTLVTYEDTGSMIYGRISSYYLADLALDYDLTIYVFKATQQDTDRIELLNERLNEAERLSSQSHFFCAKSRSGHSRYTGIFNFYDSSTGVRQMVICLDPKNSLQDRGYMSILDIGPEAEADVIPARYSYVRYIDGDLVLYKGAYPYPMHLTREEITNLKSVSSKGGWIHFMKDVSGNGSEIIVLSRPEESFLNYVVATLLVGLLIYFLLTAFSAGRAKSRVRGRHFFRQRIIFVISLSLTLTLVVMALISVFFVYKSNDDNLQTMMSEKINSVQSLVEDQFRLVETPEDMIQYDMEAILKSVSNISKTDVLLYSPQGQVVGTSSPQLLDKALVGVRMDADAYREIASDQRRVYLEKNKLRLSTYYSLYAPVYNQSGEMIAIVCSIYTDDYYDFESEAMSHLATILAVFLVLLIVTRFIVIRVVDRIFRPLTAIGRKMEEFDSGKLEHIVYESNDEITSVVKAYNGMVDQIEASNMILAQAERDKAWSAMARQIAHEIKNPLTPMKLQIQRIIRLKDKNAPDWQEKFDEVSKIVLYHIDVLSDIANEFLLFAKVDTEEKIEVNLDKLIREEVLMYEHREDIEITYMGFPDAVVMAPKPQISRVLINLINNATQAIEGQMRDNPEITRGSILVSLRKAADEAGYEIVVEDDGPGVDEENQARLFNSGFTTKDGGTGIGLTMSRSILEKCGATINYSRSVTLGGASFRIYYPKASD